MYVRIFILFIPLVAARYKVYKTGKAYYFNIEGHSMRATINNKRYLVVNSPTFSRKWALPSDSDSDNARTMRENGVFQIVIPRYKSPTLSGGHFKRGSIIKIDFDDVCATFDGSIPECGKPCKHGQLLEDFVVEKDEVIVKLRSCMFDSPVSEAIFHSFDYEIAIEDDTEEDIEKGELRVDNSGAGWFDRHGIERDY